MPGIFADLLLGERQQTVKKLVRDEIGQSDMKAIVNAGYTSPLKQLGRGGQAVVFQWSHTLHDSIKDQSVAIKSKHKLSTLMTSKANKYDDLAWEANIMDYLQNARNIQSGLVPFIDMLMFKPARDASYTKHLVMGFCDGGTLHDIWSRQPKKRFSEQDAAIVVKSLAITLGKCHSAGVVHRDIKMNNIFLKSVAVEDQKKKLKKRKLTPRSIKSYEVMLGDFGFSTFLNPNPRGETQSMLNEVVGTPFYMAPEMQSDPVAYDHRADIWSLGVVLHVMLSGDIDLPQKLDFHSDHRYSYLSFHARDVLSKMLQRDPDSRITLEQLCQHPWLNTSVVTTL